jgi:hypothetical protein
MDSSQSPPLNDQRHKDDGVPIVTKEGSTAEEAQFGGPARNSDRLVSMTEPPIGVDIAAELTAPPPDAGPQPAAVATSSKFIKQLEALARDFAVRQNGVRDSSDQGIATAQEGSSFSAGLRAVEPSIDKPLIGRRTCFTAASCFIVALIGVGATFAWQFHSVSISKPPNALDVAVEQSGSTAAGQVSVENVALPQSAPVTQTAPAPSATATSPELVQQLEVVKRDLAVVRRSVEELAAKQEQFEQLAAAQTQLAAQQEQMAQTIAKLQVIEQNTRRKISPPPVSRAVTTPRRNALRDDAPPESAAQLSPAPHPEPAPRPPLPVPQ